MDDGGGSKLSGIRQIVRLKEMFQKWQTVTLGSKDSNPGGIPPIINKRLTNLLYCDSDEDSCYSPQPPHDVPKGYLAVYVGPELRRFIIPTTYLSHSLFKVLLEKAAEEFGFDQSGGLTIPCEIETFKYLLNCMENHDDTSVDSWWNCSWKRSNCGRINTCSHLHRRKTMVLVSTLSSILVLISCMKNDITPQQKRFVMGHLFVQQLLKIYVLFIQCSPNTCTFPTYSNRTFLTFNEEYIHSGMRKCVSFDYEL
ncbi:uncharacterized protein LOC106767875 isoform X1 [Vigna radiata var. radiata]|uniref:Uncharacterized protein LOC106767875 isoform X1 n=1 Tax=Vigna radiata var. radiata TaxID=3916 RepID=A0A3Q0F8H0_VIGRR|nr:uncharacterized protein LOC106767875 isoform X1 [Vigna radiata var. radiata]